jgi:hypothetical protein
VKAEVIYFGDSVGRETRAMDVKEAVALARRYLQEVFAEEKIVNLGLEEIEYDDAQHLWSITLGFSRPWDNTAQGAIAAALGTPKQREYKVVKIDDKDKRGIAIKNREPTV